MNLFTFLNIRPRSVVLCFLMGVTGELFAGQALAFVMYFFPALIADYKGAVSSLLENSVSMILLVAILAPVLEELVFRFAILSAAEKMCGFTIANIIQAVFFGIYHMNLIQGIYAFFFGLFIGYIRKYTGSVVPCMVFHIAFNVTGLLVDELPRYVFPMWVVTLILVVSLAVLVRSFLMLRKSGCDPQKA